jgi:hypothetical protein
MSDEPHFVNPPWVYSPSEVEQWINATYPTHKVGKSHVERSKKEKFLKNIEIVLDLDVEKKILHPSNILLNTLRKIAGRERIEEHFELLPTAELFIRGLAQTKFHYMAKITVDGKSIYDHSEKKQDLRHTIELLTEFAHNKKNAESIRLIAYLDERQDCIADITIKRIHPKKEHSILIRIKGEIEETRFHRFLNYLRKHLSVDFTESE